MSLWRAHEVIGNSATEQHPIHTYEVEGSYDVTLSITTDTGNEGIPYTATILTGSLDIDEFLPNELEIYQELSAAFGRNGIQALLIEQAVPEIQNNANELIEKLSENKMQILLNLTGGRLDRQTGIPSEELEIKISDEMGIRNYETFSGGESFRIDFAIRIALSKLLASRSGAPLPILFIDEGFGSQDCKSGGGLEHPP